VHTPEYQCNQFKRDPIRNRQPVEFLEQRRHVVILQSIKFIISVAHCRLDFTNFTSGPHRLTVQLREERTADGSSGMQAAPRALSCHNQGASAQAL